MTTGRAEWVAPTLDAAEPCGDLGVRALYDAIQSDFVKLRSDWAFYEFVYGQREVVELLNEASGPTTGLMQEAIDSLVFLGIAKLTDPARQGSNRNASLHALVADTGLSEDVTSRLSSLCGHVRKHRSSRLAHTDRTWRLGAKDLPDVCRVDITAVLDEIGHILSVVARTLGAEETDASWWARGKDEAIEFVNVVRIGLEERKMRVSAWHSSRSVEDKAAAEEVLRPAWLFNPHAEMEG